MEEPNYGLSCESLQTGLLNKDQEMVRIEIDKLCFDLYPREQEGGIKQSTNLGLLIERINACNKLNSEVHCYVCIKTMPAQSEILVRVDSANSEVFRIIDIITPSDDKLQSKADSFASFYNKTFYLLIESFFSNLHVHKLKQIPVINCNNLFFNKFL